MKVSDIKLIQRILKERGLYTADIDGKRGPKTDQGILQALHGYAMQLPDTWGQWSPKRQAIAYLQLLCHEQDIDAGVIDGLLGPQTLTASERLRHLIKTGSLPRAFGDILPIRANPHNFPLERDASLIEYFGEPCQVPLVKVTCPWELRLDWELTAKTQTISIHEKLADSLTTILEHAYDHYGLDGIKTLGLDRYGGSYNCRKKRGSTSNWSTHAWGISLDWFPSKNRLSWDNTQARLAHTDADAWWEFWEQEGWYSLGRSENRDWMHVQAAKR